MIDKIKTFSEIFINLLNVITNWPVLLFAFLIIYRKQLFNVIPSLLLNLADRIKTVSYPGGTIDFNDLTKGLSKVSDSDLQMNVIKSIRTEIIDDSASIDEKDIEEDEWEAEEDDTEEEGIEEDDGFKEELEKLKRKN